MSNPIIQADCQTILAAVPEAPERLANQTLMVTGAAGFLCSYFLDLVATLNEAQPQSPCRVIAIDNHLSGLPARVAHLEGRPHFTFLHHDLRNPFTLNEPVHWIIHGAGIASPPLYRRYPLETIDVAVTGTRSMLELARLQAVHGMLLLSTSEIYGDPDPSAIPTPETYRGLVSCTGPRACYDESKRLAETLATTYHQLYGTPVKQVRPFNVYGPGQRLDDGRVVPDLMGAAVAGRPLVLHSDGQATRAFCYVADAITAMLTVLFRGAAGEPYNIGNDEAELPISRLATLMAEVAQGQANAIQYQASADPHYLTDNPQRRCPDITKVRALGYQPRVMLAEGLQRTLRSYTETEA